MGSTGPEGLRTDQLPELTSVHLDRLEVVVKEASCSVVQETFLAFSTKTTNTPTAQLLVARRN